MSRSAASMRAWTSVGQSGSAKERRAAPGADDGQKSISNASGSAVAVTTRCCRGAAGGRRAPFFDGRQKLAEIQLPGMAAVGILDDGRPIGVFTGPAQQRAMDRSAGSADRIAFNGAWRGSLPGKGQSGRARDGVDDEGAQQRLMVSPGTKAESARKGLVEGHVGEDGQADDAREVQEYEPAGHGGDEGVGSHPSGGMGTWRYQHHPADDEGCRCITVQVAG